MIRRPLIVAVAALGFAAVGTGAPPSPIGVVVQRDAHIPEPWRKLTAEEKAKLELPFVLASLGSEIRQLLNTQLEKKLAG